MFSSIVYKRIFKDLFLLFLHVSPLRGRKYLRYFLQLEDFFFFLLLPRGHTNTYRDTSIPKRIFCGRKRQGSTILLYI